MPRIDLDILNQKQTPAFYASSLATRPAAGFVGRIFIDSDSPSTGLYRDTGTAWVQIADAGAGTTGTLQQVTTNGSSTNVGISVTTKGIGIGTAIPGANILDVHGTTGVLAQLENTTTQNSLLSFRNQGAGVWSVGNGYNAGANDFIVYDAVSFINRFTIKATGQTFIGADTTSSGLFVVNSSTSDNHIVIIGANAPSIRLRNAGTSPTLNAGLGISTATNNFIQGSVSGDYCIFNSSTTPSPILFAIYNSGTSNTQEFGRFSSIGTFNLKSRLNVNNATDSSSYSLNVEGVSQSTLFYTNNGATEVRYLKAINTGGESFFGRENNVGTGFGATAYTTVIKGTGNYGMEFIVNDTIKWLSVTSAGNGTFIGSISSQSAIFSTGLNVTGNGGSLNTANTFNLDQYIGASRLYTHGPDVSTKGSFEFHTNSSNGSIDVIALKINSSGIINIQNTPTYATNALAISGGLVFGDIYKNSVGVLSIVY